uniref:insulin receptor-like n=1 Tax=Myxine glutinosa TaxID=7769 RepID=UPI00358E5829
SGDVWEGEVCGSLDVRNSLNQLQRLENCTVIEGFLQILLIFRSRTEDFRGLSYPRLTMITDYLLLFRVTGLESLHDLFPNLAVIRGTRLFYNYALVVFEMLDVKELGLHGLKNITRGAIRLEKNPDLCYVESIDWSLIVDSVENNYIVGNKPLSECGDVCPGVLTGNSVCPRTTFNGLSAPRCWSSSYCQQVCPVRCRLLSCSASGECCHSECLGGCLKPGDPTHCRACRHYQHGGVCVPSCPPGLLHFHGWRCVSYNRCRAEDQRCSQDGRKECMRHVAHDGKCMPGCPSGYSTIDESNVMCRKCVGPCPKVCLVGKKTVDSVTAAQDLHGCTIINGSLIINILGGSNITPDLEEHLGRIEVITGYMKIKRSFALISLSFFKNLRLIQGETLEPGNYSFYVLDNQNLRQLWNWNQHSLTITRGKIFFHFNPKLCLSEIHTLEEQTGTKGRQESMDISLKNNGNQASCEHMVLHFLNVSTSKNTLFLKWTPYQLSDYRDMLGFVIYYKEAPHKNVTELDGQDVCGFNSWTVIDIETHKSYKARASGALPSAMLRGLKPWTQYAVFVRAYMLNEHLGHGAKSNVLFIRTNASAPTIPRDVVLTSQFSSNLTVKWKAPLNSNGNVTHYHIRWHRQAEDAELYTLDYCLRDLKMPTRSPTILKTDAAGGGRINSSGPGGVNSEVCCSCPKSERELQREREQVAFQKAFETFLHNQVFRPRTLQAQVTPRSLWNFNTTHSTAFPSAQATQQSPARIQYPFYETKVFAQEQMVISGLHHFTVYLVEVHACNHKYESVGCSAANYIHARTLAKVHADDIPGPVVARLLEKDVMHLSWHEPEHPNGLILLYEVHFGQDHKMDHQICVSRNEYVNTHGGINLRNLQSGNYTAYIRAVSLAGNGSFTPAVHFFVTKQGENHNNMVLPVLLTVISVLFCCIALGIALLFMLRKKTNGTFLTGMLYTSVNPEYISANDVYVPDEWEVPRERISILWELGQGSFGMVYEGVVRDLVREEVETRVAIKTINVGTCLQQHVEFLNEASVMKSFSSHHVVTLLGVVSQSQPALVIMELMVHGDLKSFLRVLRPGADINTDRPPPSLREVLRMAAEVSDGMAYLDAKKFVHRDLAARNCMVSDDYTVKIGDFGMARDVYETDYYRKGGQGLLPVRWMAPESLKDGVFTTYSDVWSFGVVLWEIATLAEQPYQGMSNEQVLRFVVDGGTLSFPVGCADKLTRLMSMCWKNDPKMRPTFLEILESLESELDNSFKQISFFHSKENSRNGRSSTDAAQHVPTGLCTSGMVSESRDGGPFRMRATEHHYVDHLTSR